MTHAKSIRSIVSPDERRHLTVLFCDLVGSTELISRVDPEDARDTLRQYQALCREVIEAHGGFIAQFLGDGALAYFGFPQASEDAAEHAVLCGLELVKAIAEITTPAGSLAVRVGLASGLTVVGEMTEAGPEQLAVTGHAVNLASRIQASVGPGSVGLSNSTYRLVRGCFDCTSLGHFTLKGVELPVQLWIAHRARVVPRRWHPIGAHGLLLGRDTELVCLMRLWQQTKKGRVHAAVIWGEAGIGKTRLIRALRRSTGRDATTMVFQCSALHMLTPLHPITSAVERAAKHESTTGRLSLIQKIAALFGGPDNADAQLVGTLLSPRAEGAVDIAALPAGQRREVLFDRLVAHILKSAETQPHLIIVEDVHWSDPTTVELGRRLLKAATNQRLLILLSYRSESEPHLIADLNSESVRLAALPDDIQFSIIERTCEGQLSCSTAATIAARSDGNPLHAIEMTLSALDHDSISPTVTKVPESLFDGFAGRLDRLGTAKTVAQCASAIGRQFSRKLLAEVTGKSRTALSPVVARLTAAGIFRPVPVDKDLFEFRHSLLQEVAYETLLRRDRANLHARIGGALENTQPGGDPPELIAHHWLAAEKPERALPHYLAAASNALDHGMYTEAMGHLDQAIILYPKVRDVVPRKLEFDLHLNLGRASYILNGPAHEQTVAAFTKAQALVDLVDTEQQAILLHGIFSGYHFASRFDLATEPAEKMLALAETSGSRTQMCLAHRMLGYLSFFQGNSKVARVHFGRVRDLYCFSEDVPFAPKFGADHLTATEGFASVLDAIEGRADAVQHARNNLDHAINTEHPPSVGWAYAASAYVEYYRRDREAAGRIASEGAKFCHEHHIAAWFAHCSLFEVWANRNRTSDDVLAVMAIAGAGIRLGLPLFRGVLAEVLCSTDAGPEAVDEINRAILEANQLGQFVFVTHLQLLKSEILRKTNLGSRDEIAAACHDAITAARQFGSRLPSQKPWRPGSDLHSMHDLRLQV